MKNLLLSFFLLLLLASPGLFAQPASERFPYGVASGDPLPDGIILWTKLAPADRRQALAVKWVLATDSALQSIVRRGTAEANPLSDFTVKLDLRDLQPGTHYFYQFEQGGATSLIGRTKTAPEGPVDHLRFAVVSCSNYQAGYFNAYGNLARRPELDAIIHLGDYVYEYPDGRYGDSALMASGARAIEPKTELLSLEGYRARYATYRRDPDLQRLHQLHPFITVWDDHETANNAYDGGAQNHQPDEGDWATRLGYARQAYAEWLPIRGDAQPLYRQLAYGDLADLFMLDTRIEGRDKQIEDVTDPALYDASRSLLGNQQKAWLKKSLQSSQARWKILGNQVMFAEYHVGWAAAGLDNYTPEQLESIFLDIWDGYPVERAELIDFWQAENIDNVVIVTGDVHCSFAYDIATEQGAAAVEFVTPGITSANYDENIGLERARQFQYQINRPLPNGPNPNPHMKYADLIRHGYLLLDLTPERARADWYYSADILQQTPEEIHGATWLTRSGQNRLEKGE